MSTVIKAKDWAVKIQYVDSVITCKCEPASNPMAGRTQDGYTSIKGAPTELMVQVNDSGRWRRVWILQFSNAASYFVNVDGHRQYLTAGQLDDAFHKLEVCD